MRYMGLDFGGHTVGVALSDATGTIAAGRETIRRSKENALRSTMRRIEQIAADNGVGTIVLGLPLYPSGGISPRAEKTLEFRDLLVKRLPDIPVVMQDERFTTVEAEEMLRRRGIPRSKWKEHIDSLAAEVILQDYLNNE